MSRFRRRLMKKKRMRNFLDMSLAEIKKGYISFSAHAYNTSTDNNSLFVIPVENNSTYRVERTNPYDVTYYRFRAGLTKGRPVNKAGVVNFTISAQDLNGASAGTKGVDSFEIQSDTCDYLIVFFCTDGMNMSSSDAFATITVEKIA